MEEVQSSLVVSSQQEENVIATTTTTTPTTTPSIMLSEEALAEHSKKLPFILSSNRKQLHQHTLSNSSSFEEIIVIGSTTTGGDLLQHNVVENEYGQVPPNRIYGIHKKGTPTQHRYSSGTTTTTTTTTTTNNNNSSSLGTTTTTTTSGGNNSTIVVGPFLDGSVVTVMNTPGSCTNSNCATSRSRSCSPSIIGRSGGAVAATITSNNNNTNTNNSTTVPTIMNSVMTDGNSSISSMDDYECDLYTDRAGVIDDLSESQRKLHSSKDFHLPATVLERMCEDSLEDNHAFTDLVQQQRTSSSSSSSRNSNMNRDRDGGGSGGDGNFSSNASRVSHVSGSNAGDGMLEPLDECDEGLENDSLEDSVTDQNYDVGGGMNDVGHLVGGGTNNTNGTDPIHNPIMIPTTTVILTNMENLTLESANNELMRQQQQGYSSQAGSVSLFESVATGGVVVVGTGNASTTTTTTTAAAAAATTTGTTGCNDTTTTVGSVSVPPYE